MAVPVKFNNTKFVTNAMSPTTNASQAVVKGPNNQGEINRGFVHLNYPNVSEAPVLNIIQGSPPRDQQNQPNWNPRPEIKEDSVETSPVLLQRLIEKQKGDLVQIQQPSISEVDPRALIPATSKNITKNAQNYLTLPNKQTKKNRLGVFGKLTKRVKNTLLNPFKAGPGPKRNPFTNGPSSALSQRSRRARSTRRSQRRRRSTRRN